VYALRAAGNFHGDYTGGTRILAQIGQKGMFFKGLNFLLTSFDEMVR